MAFFGITIFILWVVFFLYWMISLRGVKKDISVATSWQTSSITRIFLTIAMIVVIEFFYAYNWFGIDYTQPNSVILQSIGVVLCSAGISFAIWARIHLGANWSYIPAVKEGHELITSGPYRIVRHPIYTGILVAMLGSALVSGWPWLIILIFIGVMFVWRVKVEEELMTQLFPQQYPEYKKGTKALIPLIW